MKIAKLVGENVRSSLELSLRRRPSSMAQAMFYTMPLLLQSQRSNGAKLGEDPDHLQRRKWRSEDDGSSGKVLLWKGKVERVNDGLCFQRF